MPSDAQAFALNVTAVPAKPLDFLSVWPSGQAFPGVSTLNQTDGDVVANAAIVPAGDNSSVDVAAGVATDVVIDVNGYFAPPSSADLALYVVTPPAASWTLGPGPPDLER